MRPRQRARQSAGRGMTKESALVRAFAGGDLLHQFDDTAVKLGIGDPGECTRQRQAFGGREKIGNIGRRRALAEALYAGRATWAAIEQEGYRYLQYFGDLLQTAG